MAFEAHPPDFPLLQDGPQRAPQLLGGRLAGGPRTRRKRAEDHSEEVPRGRALSAKNKDML